MATSKFQIVRYPAKAVAAARRPVKSEVGIVSSSFILRIGLEGLVNTYLKHVGILHFRTWRECQQALERRNSAVPLDLLGALPESGAELRCIKLMDRSQQVRSWLYLCHSVEQSSRWRVVLRNQNMSVFTLDVPGEVLAAHLHGCVSLHPPQHSPQKPPLLTSRQWEVWCLLGEGLAAADIADSLGVAVPTVRNHLRSIYQQLGVRNRKQAIAVYNKREVQLEN